MTGANTGEECLRVAVLDWPPFTEVISGPPYVVVGAMVGVMDIISKHLNFCYRVVVVQDGDWGRQLDNGSYTGLLGYFDRGLADLTMVPVSMTPLRAQVLDFSESLFTDDQRFIYTRPTPEADVRGFIKPYTSMVWLLILLGSLLVCAATCLVHMLNSNLQERLYDGQPEEYVGGDPANGTGYPPAPANGTGYTPGPVSGSGTSPDGSSLHKSVLWTVSTLLSQSVPWSPEGGGVRVVAGMWLLVSLIVGGVYRSNLKAMLILPTLRVPFDNLRQLVQTDIPTYVISGSVFHQILMQAPDNTTLGELRKQALIHGHIDIAIPQINAGLIAAIASFTGLRKVMHDSFSRVGYCKLYVTSEAAIFTAVGIGFPKKSKLKPKVSKIVSGLKEFGIIEHLYSKEYQNATDCLKPVGQTTTSDLRPLEMGDFYGVFSLYAGGALLGTLTFLLELLVYDVGERNKEKMRRLQSGGKSRSRP